MMENETMAIDQQVYLAADIQRILGIGRSRSYTFLEDMYQLKNPTFRVLKIGRLYRVPKESFDKWLKGL